MKDYKTKRTYSNGEKHVVYYIHGDYKYPSSLGWDYHELLQIVKDNRNLSVYIGLTGKGSKKVSVKKHNQ